MKQNSSSLTSIHGLGNTGVGTVAPNEDVNLEDLRVSGLLAVVVREVDEEGILLALGHVDLGDKTVDGNGTVLDGALAEVSVKNLTPASQKEIQSLADKKGAHTAFLCVSVALKFGRLSVHRPGHANVLVISEGLADGNLLASGGDHKHLADPAKNRRQSEGV